MRKSGLALIATLFSFILAIQAAADVNVLIIGGTKDTSERFGGNSKPFSPAAIGTQLKSIISGCSGMGNVNVTVVDRYATATTVMGHTTYAYNLASWFHWPFPKGAESNRWANLRGQAGTNWNYVVLIPEPYTVEYTPGLFAYGAAKIAEEVAKGSAETILFMPWPASGSSRSIAHYKDVVYRAGRSGGVKVAPGGLAWQAIKGTALTNPNPNADGAFIAAASIYSTIYKQSAKVSTYVYNDTWADTVNTTEVNNRTVKNYTGNFSFQNPYLARSDYKRKIYFSSRGTSTESYFQGTANSAIGRCKVGVTSYCPWNRSTNDWYNNGGDEPWTKWPTNTPVPIAWNDGRDGATAEWYKSYLVNPAYWDFAYGYIYQANTWGKPVEDANDHYVSVMFAQDNELASRMMSQGNSARNLPVRTLWASIHKEFPNLNPLLDGSGPHLSLFESEAVGTYMYTLYSGRCPLDPKPAGVDTNWVARKIGYETAWQLGRCQMRAPGFKVMPSSATALTVTPTTKGTNTVQFILPPRSNVTVSVTVDNPKAVIVNPHTLNFTTNNYDTAQTVTFAGLPGAVLNDGFNVKFSTTSGDEVYNGLYDEWAYTNKRTVTQATVISEKGTNSVTCQQNAPLSITPGVAGIASNNTVFAGPVNGSVAVTGANLVYTPKLGYTGLDSFAYAVNSGGTVTRGYVVISVVPSSNKSVAVVSAHGGANPGSVITNSGAALSFFITNSPFISGGTIKYVATGGTVAGNSYTQVNPTNITLTLTNNATLTWAWTTNYWLAANTTAGGSLNVTSAWYTFGGSAVITAAASNQWVFAGWSGATNGCSISGNVITAPMTNARSITANFAINANTAPVATAQSVTTAEDTAKAIVLTGTDADGDALTYAIVTQPAHGALSGTVPSVTYTPSANYSGADSFTFKVTDPSGASGQAAVSITVTEVNDTPVAEPLIYEPFDMVVGQNISGQTGGTGLAPAKWSGADFTVANGSLSCGEINTAGNSAVNNNATRYRGCGINVGTTLSDAGVMNPGSNLWFSILAVSSDTQANTRTYIAIGAGAADGYGRIGSPTNTGFAIVLDTGTIRAYGQDAGRAFNGSSSAIDNGTHLLVGKITWASDVGSDTNDTLEVFLPDASMNLPSSPVSSCSRSLDQSQFGTISFAGGYSIGYPQVDEFTFGATYNEVVTVPDAGSVSWTPAEIATALWLDASDSATVVATGGSVSQWNDKSGNGRNAVQTNSAAQPALTTGGLNGINVLTFDGSSDFLNVNLDFLAGVSHSAFIVTKTVAYKNIYGAANASSGASSLHVGFRDAASYRMNYWGNDWYGVISTNFRVSEANILNYVWVPGASKEIFANGSSEGKGGTAGTIAAMAGGGRIASVVGQGFYGGQIAEIIMITGTVTEEERQKIEGYLAHKWGRTVNLLVGHPYKDAAPQASQVLAAAAASAPAESGDLKMAAAPIVASAEGAVVEGLACVIDLLPGMNLVSLPLTPVQTNAAILFGTTEVYEFDATGAYVQAKTVEAGRGYWVNVEKVVELSISGSIPADSTVELMAGWTLFGLKGAAYPDGIAVADLAGGDLLVQCGLKRWNPATQVYEDVEVLVPGEGYSVDCQEPLSIVLP